MAPKHPQKVLTIDQERRLLGWTEQNRRRRDYLVLLTILRTGLRPTELCELWVSDISSNGEIFAQLSVRPGIAHNQAPRTIPIPNDLREQLAIFLHWKRQNSEPTEPSSFLFASQKSPQITVRHLQRIVHEAPQGALGESYRAADLQRTFESRHKKETETKFSDAAPSEIETVVPKRGVWQTYDQSDGLPAGVDSILQDRRGYLWLGTSAGLCRYDGTELITYTAADGLPGNFVTAICEDHRGRLWIGTSQDVCEDGQGRVWFVIRDEHADRGYGVTCFDGNHFTTYTTEQGLESNYIWSIYLDHQGRLWFGFISRGRGVSCFDGVRFTPYTSEDGLLSNWANRVIQDREGQFWVSHWNAGLTCFDNETLQFLTDEPVEVLTQDSRGRLWFSNDKSELCCLYEGQQRRRPFNALIRCLLEDSSGRFWVATYGDGLFCYDSADAVWEDGGGTPLNQAHYTMENGLGSNNVKALIEASDGTIWFATHSPSDDRPGCLCCFRGQRFSAMPIPHRKIYVLFEDGRGHIWMGGAADWGGGWGLSCYDGGRPQGSRLRTYTTAEGLPDDRVFSIVEDDAGDLWIGTGQGLCRFDGKSLAEREPRSTDRGRFRVYGREQGLPSALHGQSAKDAAGHLWFGSIGGLYRTDGAHFQTLTTADGLPSNRVSGLVPQPDGSMIIGTGRGIVHYRPTATVPPLIEIREVVADRVYQNPTDIEILAVGETHASPLIISYHSVSFATKKMRYSYILEGYHPHPSSPLTPGPSPTGGEGRREGEGDMWQDTWERSVRYENLPVGEYTFKVIAINRDLVESVAPATLKLTVVPDSRDLVISTMQTEIARLRREVGSKYHFANIIGRSATIKQMRVLMEKAIDSGLPVLITGETGAGKELVAKAIHTNSPRKDHPMRELNCGAIPKDLVASTLFGHRKGAFTGADTDRMGVFEDAKGGTVILDEIGEMPNDAQVHLLRVLQERTVIRIGEFAPREVDVRIIAITNRDLEKEVGAGRFRADLYHRLKVFPIHVPPLRERTDDIPLLAEHFLQQASQQQTKEVDGFGPDVFEMLSSYSWTGNIRELENEVYRAVALVEGGMQIQTYHFSSLIHRGESLITEAISEGSGYAESVKRFQRRLIEQVLSECGGNRHEAARRLKMYRPNLIDLIKRLGIKERET